MRTVLLAAACVLGFAGAAEAQFQPGYGGYPGAYGPGYGFPQYTNPGMLMPNIYNRTNQPLSPSNRWERNRTAGSWAAMAARSPP